MLMSVRGAIAATLLAGSALAATPAFADEAAPPKDFTVTGNVALTTDYRFRGVSLSNGDPAIQGGITVSHKSGVYVSTWSSSIHGGDVYGDQELDLIAGWTGNVGGGLTLDGGILYYVYPSGHVGDANYWEPYASVSYAVGPAKLKAGLAYAWKQKGLLDNDGFHSDNLYLYGNIDFAVPKTPVTISGHLGYTDGVLSPCYYCAGTRSFNDKTGMDFSIGASMTVYGPLSVGVSYIGVSGVSIDGYTDDTVVGTLTASF
ncbi:uncharacterized protein (TIGR02001 family) [Novosphingobium sp. PhB165]|uniref:TorF family putative porin n=1 Tax=Novosphingobium sp. PhB165 TaxID=2485105 RepID=UPI0010535FB4|nr:TorF family putative porin [Novosphingobium sp. PhB165]TCM19477.1 uncharacterized protein (TIGR02001 family) [Novosphingobium sp. PhB165]